MVEWTSTNGGTMKLYDRDNPRTTGLWETITDYPLIERQYNGKTSMETSSFRFDFEPPHHCTQGETCRTTMLNVTPNISSKVL